MPNHDYALFLVQVVILLVCARLAWQTHAEASELRALVRGARDVLDDLRGAIKTADARLVDVDAPLVEQGTAVGARGDTAYGLTRLGYGRDQVARQLGLSDGETELLLNLAEQRAAPRRSSDA